MKPIHYFFLALSLLLFACNTSDSSNEQSAQSTPDSTQRTTSKTDRMLEIEEMLLGDWIEDSIEFKKNYNMPPPPVNNSRVRYQKDGYVYIPGILLTEANWDKWELANDTTLLIHKRRNNGTLTFIIDGITPNEIFYRLLWGRNFRKIKLNRIKNTDEQ